MSAVNGDGFSLDGGYHGDRPLSTVISLYRAHTGRLLLAGLFFIVKHSPVWLMPIVFADIINVAVAPTGNPFLRIGFDGVACAILVLVNIPTHTIYAYLLSATVRRIELDLRSALARKLQLLSMGFIQDRQSGAIQSKFIRDVESVQALGSFMFNVYLNAFVTILVAAAVTSYRQPLFLLFYVLAVPLAVGIVRVFRTPLKETNQRFRKQVEQMAARIGEMITLLPVTRAHGLEDIESASLDHQLAKVQRRGLMLDVTTSVFGASTWAFSQIMQLSCIIVSGYLAIKGLIQPGDVVLYNSFFALMVNSINQIVDSIPMMTKGLESVRSIGEILECPDMERNSGKNPVTSVQGKFEFQNVCFSYPGSRGGASMSDVSLTVEPGEIIAVVGESGAGKTTLMSLIIGYNRPTSGRILLDGKDMESMDLRQYRHWLSVVPQTTTLFSGTVRENIAYGIPNLTDRKLNEAIQMARVDEFLHRLPHGLDTRAGELGAKLSGGQRQRIAIARALVRDPKVIILDEATSALDVVSEKLVQEAVAQLIKGRTTFIVAHRLSTIRDASRVVVMREGRIVEIGTHEELLKLGGEFAKLSSLQK